MTMEPILSDIRKELPTLTIERLGAEFYEVYNEFKTYAAEYLAKQTAYNALLVQTVDVIKDKFKIDDSAPPPLVRTWRYTRDMWGDLYWTFMHLLSLLVSHAFTVGLTANMLDFPTLLYNMYLILPCEMCRSHYESVKNEPRVQSTIREAAYGSPATATKLLHSIINRRAHPGRKEFMVSDFALRYGCIERYNERIHKSDTYIKSGIDWQPPTHVLLTRLLSIRKLMSYRMANSLLRHSYYPKTGAMKTAALDADWPLVAGEGFDFQPDGMPANADSDRAWALGTMKSGPIQDALIDALLLFQLPNAECDLVAEAYEMPELANDPEQATRYHVRPTLGDLQCILMYMYKRYKAVIQELMSTTELGKNLTVQRKKEVERFLAAPTIENLPDRFRVISDDDGKHPHTDGAQSYLPMLHERLRKRKNP